MTIDPRIAARRAEVREGTARRDARRLLRWFGVFAVLAIAAWVAQLPAFRIEHIDVTGQAHADVAGAVETSGTALGRPLVLLWPPIVEAAIAEDPWVRDVDVVHRFPDTVAIKVVERRPVITVYLDGGAEVVADDGVVVATTPDASLAVVRLVGARPGELGGASPDRRIVGVAEFVAALPPRLAAAIEITESDDGLGATVAGLTVRLGRAVDMAAKAETLTALLDEGVPPGSIVHLVSAARPAVEVPGSVVEDDAVGDDAVEDGSAEGDSADSP